MFQFDPYDPDALRARLRQGRRGKVILAATIEYPGVRFPLEAVLEVACAEGAVVVVDDTLGVGVLGKGESQHAYGVGGGGGLLWSGLRPSGCIVQVASLAKGFSVPMAFLAGDRRLLARIVRSSNLLSASSPADLASVQAARWALKVNTTCGEALRQVLYDTVTLLRVAGGLHGAGVPFPVLSLYFPRTAAARRAGDFLLEMGVWALLQQRPGERPDSAAALRFNVSAAHAGPLAARALWVFRQLASSRDFRPSGDPS